MTAPARPAAPNESTQPAAVHGPASQGLQELQGLQRQQPPLTGALSVALTGLLALAVAMGIGRFAFTPLLPMMLHDGVIALPAASWLATANYIGYWLGAMACALQPTLWARWRIGRAPVHTWVARAGLVATVLLTLGMALPAPALWPALRLLAGVASAFVFVYVSGWCLSRLTSLGAPSWAGIIYVGPGLGIAVSGLAASAMVAARWHAATGWLVFGLLALVLTLGIWPRLSGTLPLVQPVATAQASAAAGRGLAMAVFVGAYGLAGFGYIVTATFLPVIARQALPGSVWLDLFWPLFGLGVGVGALLTVRLPVHWDRRWLLCGGYAMQAIGVLLTVGWPSLGGFAFGSLLLGLPFTAITLFAMQEARRLRPQNASALIGLLTAAYGLGQILGPPLVAWLLAHSASPAQGFERSLEMAAAALMLGVFLFAGLARRHPAA